MGVASECSLHCGELCPADSVPFELDRQVMEKVGDQVGKIVSTEAVQGARWTEELIKVKRWIR